MTRLNLMLSFLMIGMVMSAQPNLSKDFNISTSEPYIVVDAQTKQYFSDNNGFTYSIKTNDENVIVQKFEIKSMKEVARNEYKDTPPYNKAIGVVQMGDKFYYLFDSFNKETEKRSVHVREFFTQDCSLGNEKLLFSSGGEVANGSASEVIGYWGAMGGPPFTIYKSFDNSKIMINYRRKPLSKKDEVNYDLLGFFVFNSSFELVWGREVKMPYTEKQMNNLAYIVGTDGTVYMMSYLNLKHEFSLLTIPPAGEVTAKAIDGGDFVFKNLYMKENKAGNIDFLGYYANGLDYKIWEGPFGKLSFNTNGIRYFELSKQGEILTSKDIEFPLELINKYESGTDQNKNEKREEDGKAGIRDLVLRQFTVNPDGSVFILGEQYYYTETYNSKTYQKTYKFFYDDLIATKLDADGEVIWMEKLPKRQLGANGRGGMGIACLEGNNSHYILFLDNVKNADIDINEVPARHIDGRGGFLTAYKIDDASGHYTKHTLYNSLEVNNVTTYQFQTNRILQALDKILLVEVYIKDKKDMMIKMELEE